MNPPYRPVLMLSILFALVSSFLVSCSGNFDKNPIADALNHDYKAIVDGNKGINQAKIFQTRLARASSVTKVSPKSFNVDDFGAIADGRDDSEAFKKAWKEACSSKTSAIIVVPKKKTYKLKPVTFSGPCNSDIQLKIYGKIIASEKIGDYEENRRRWLVFENVENLRVRGGGTIDGNGKTWWQISCKVNKSLPCKGAPTAVTFEECKNVIVGNIKFQNAQQMHLTFQKCVNVRALNLLVTSPGNSPNTDGIHVTGSQNVRIRKSVIKTGDDCISIVSGSKYVEATDITCGPGHGISIGSLGADNSEAQVSNIIVDRATLTGTTNGVRIKTWQGGSGYAKNILFQNVVMRNVTNPIIIDQNYCDQDGPCKEQKSAVQVSNVVYRNVRGTSASEVAIKFDCSKAVPCQGIELQNANIVREEEGNAKAVCENITLKKAGIVAPKCS